MSNIATRISIYGDASSATRAFKQAGDEAQNLESRISRLGPGLQTALAGLGAGMGLTEVATQTAAYETAVNNMAKVTERSFAQVKADVAGLAPEIGSQTQLMQGYYAVMSAGVTENAAALDLLTVASQGSKAAEVTQAQTITALTKLMAGYAGEIKSATEASDLLFAIEKQGQTTFAELVPVIGDVAAISKQAGVSADEMGATLAAITQTAGGTAQAATQYRAVLVSLIKPQGEMEKLLLGMGHANGESLIQQKGLAGALMAIRDEAQASGVAIGKLFESSEALTALAPLLATNFARVNGNMDAMRDKAGATEAAFGRWKETLAGLWDTSRNLLSDITISTGNVLAPEAVDTMQAFNAALGFVRDNFDTVSRAALALGVSYAAMTAAKKIATSESLRLNAALLTGDAVMLGSARASAQKSLAVKNESATSLANARASVIDAESQLAASRARQLNAVSSRQMRQASAAETAALRQLLTAQNAATAAEQRLAVATMEAAAAQSRATIAARSLTALRAGFSGLLSMLGGPVGAGIMVAAGAMTFLATKQSLAEQAAEQHKLALEQYSHAVKTAADGTKNLADQHHAVARAGLTTALQSQHQALQQFAASIKLMDFSTSTTIFSSFKEEAKGLNDLSEDVLKGKASFHEMEIAIADTLNQVREAGEGSSRFARKLEEALTVARQGREAEETFRDIKTQVQSLGGEASTTTANVNELAAAMRLLEGNAAAPANSLEGAIKRLRELTKETESAKKEAQELRKAQARLDLRTLQYGIHGARQSGDTKEADKLQTEYDRQAKRIGEIGKKSGDGGTSKITNAENSIKSLRAEMDKLSGTGSNVELSLTKKFNEIEKLGIAAKMSGPQIAELKGQYAEAFQVDVLRRFDAELIKISGDAKAIRFQEVTQQTEEWRKQLESLVDAEKMSANEATARVESMRSALEKQLHVKDAQLAANFMKELSGLSGNYGDSVAAVNEQLRIQAEVYRSELPPSMQGYVDQWERLKRLENARDPMSGFERGMRKWSSSATDAASQVEGALTSAFDGASDALANMVMTGKADFASLANSIIADMVRIAAKQAIGGIVGGIGNIIGSALGGWLGGGSSVSTGIGSAGWQGGAGGSWAGGNWNSGMSLGVSSFHAGGFVGVDGSRKRAMPVSVFENAPRFHDGGGYFRQDEYPAVLQYGERVLNRRDTAAFDAAMRMPRAPMPVVPKQASAAPTIIIHNYAKGTEAKAEAQQQPDGSFKIDVIVEEVDRRMAQRVTNGKSHTARALDATRGMSPAPAAYRG